MILALPLPLTKPSRTPRLRSVLALSAALLALPATSAWADRPVNETRSLNADAKLHIKNVAGEVVVKSWDQPRMQLTGTLGDQVEALTITGHADRLNVEVELPSRVRHGQGHADLLFMVPVGVHLEVNAVSADVTVTGLDGGNHRLQSVSGDIEATLGQGNRLELDTVSGDIRAESHAIEQDMQSVSGDIEATGSNRRIRLATVSGDITAPAGGQFEAQSISGEIQITGQQAIQSADLESVSGDLEVSGILAADGEITAATMSGNIDLQLASAPARIDASAGAGSIRSDWGDVRGPRFGPGSSLRYEGAGQGRIDAESFSGTIRIHR